jgi:hypothetical protein
MLARFDGFDIIKKPYNTFQIQLKQSSPVLINSLLKTKIISGYSDDNYKSITLKACSVKTLRECSYHFAINDVWKICSSLVKQLSYLISEERHTILGYNPEYMIVINDKTFVYMAPELVVPLMDDSNSVMVCFPFSPLDFYVSPEIQNMRTIPTFIHYKTSYFSFACFILYLLVGTNDFYIEIITSQEKKHITIDVLRNHPVEHTKLYWLLSRCLAEQPDKRSILLI